MFKIITLALVLGAAPAMAQSPQYRSQMLEKPMIPSSEIARRKAERQPPSIQQSLDKAHCQLNLLNTWEPYDPKCMWQ